MKCLQIGETSWGTLYKETTTYTNARSARKHSDIKYKYTCSSKAWCIAYLQLLGEMLSC